MANTYTQLGQDTFQRTDENPLSDGGNWAALAGSTGLKLLTNTPVPITSFTVCISVFNGIVTSWPNDQYAEVTISEAVGGSTIWGPVVRAQANGSWYDIEAVSGSSFNIVERPSQTVIASAATPPTLAAGGVVRLEAQGTGLTALTAYYNGVSQCSGSGAAVTSGSPGIVAYGASTSVSNMTEWDAGSIYSGTVSSVGLSPSSVTYPTTSTGTVTLSAAAPVGGIVVSLTSGDVTIATVPATVTVLAGQTTATFTATTLNKAGSVSISGSINGGSSASGTLVVSAPAPTRSTRSK